MKNMHVVAPWTLLPGVAALLPIDDSYYRVIKKSLCTWQLQYILSVFEQSSHNWWVKDGHHRIHSECGPRYTEHGLRQHQFGMSINVWRLAGDTLNITCNFLYCNQVHRDFLTTLYEASRFLQSGQPNVRKVPQFMPVQYSPIICSLTTDSLSRKP
jgi:hypothetical protein